MTLVFPDLHFLASALHMRISKLRAADPPSQICANPAGEEAQSSGARSKFGAVPSSNFPCILSFMHLGRLWLLEKLQTESSRRGLGGQGADRGGWQSVKRNIPRKKKLAAHLLQLNASSVAISLQQLGADPHRGRDRVRPLLI